MKTNSKGLNITLWIVQGILAFMFIMAGFMKTFSPVEALLEGGMLKSPDEIGLVRFIGISELLGGLGMILPMLLKWKKLTSLAALGLFIIMVLAVGVHIKAGDTVGHTMVPATLGLLAAFVAWGRRKN
ncbi:MAG: DoxX family protein [Bacteroidota bacterium]